MDELEIAGKQYISTRRAGREHGYHSDYIGQLIRGKKVQGQKVGRSWYVDAESLATYLGKEPVAAVAPKVAVVEPTPVAVAEVAPVVVEEKKVEEAPVVEMVETAVALPIKKEIEIVEKEEVVAKPVEEKIAEEVQVPIKIVEEKVLVAETPIAIQKEEKAPSPSGLVYVQDDAPSLPQVRTAASDAYAATPIAKAAVAFAPQSSISLSKSLALVSLLGLALVLGVSAVAYLSLNVQVVNQTATSYYGIQK